MTINSPAAMMLAFYICVAEQQGSRGPSCATIQTDILKEYIAQKEWIFRRSPLRLVTDMVQFCSRSYPAGTRSRSPATTSARLLERGSGACLHPRERICLRRRGDRAGAGRRRLRAAALVLLQRPSRLLRGDRQVPRGPPDLGARAARPLWRQEPALLADALPHPDRRGLADRPAARGEHRPHRSSRPRAVLGGTSRCTRTPLTRRWPCRPRTWFDWPFAAQQVIAHETGVVNTIDPLGGSYYVEDLTNRLEAEAYDYFDRIEKLGGVVPAIKENFFQREIAEARSATRPRSRRAADHRRRQLATSSRTSRSRS